MQTQKKKFHSLLHAADLLERLLEIHLQPLGVRPKQARILNALNRMGSASQIRLAQEFEVSEASMSTMTSRLLDAGYIIREIDPKNRSGYLLFVSEKGLAMISEIHRVWSEVDKLIESIVGHEDADTLSRITSQLRDAFGGRVAGLDKSGRRKVRNKERNYVNVDENKA